MNDIVTISLAGLGGAVITSAVSLYIHQIHQKNRTTPKGHAKELLEKIGKFLKSEKLDYYFMDSAKENRHITNAIYSHASSTIIATAFHENPANYGKNDLAANLQFGGSLFTRITSEDVCDSESQIRARSCLENILPGAQLVIIPKGEIFTRVDGIFCKFVDGTYLCLIAFRNPENKVHNRGTLFHDGISITFFDYYNQLIKKYQFQ